MELKLTALLEVAWIAGTLPILVASMPSSRISAFHGALLGFAKRGKTMQSSSHVLRRYRASLVAYLYHPLRSHGKKEPWFLDAKFTVPQRFFMHFYMVAMVWTTLLVLTTWLYAYRLAPLGSESLHYSTVSSHLTGDSHISSMHKSHSTPVEHRYKVWRSVFLLLLMEVQVLRRLYETAYVFNYSNSARMHILGYLIGLLEVLKLFPLLFIYLFITTSSFYTAAPLSLCSICAPEVLKFAADRVSEFIVKGRDWRQVIECDWWGYVNPLAKLGWCQWIGAVIFIWGWIHQQRCHAILGSLREQTEQTNKYVIPHGDWFEIVSCPHYLAEIICLCAVMQVIYAGLLVASGGADLTIWLLFGFVVANLVFAAAETQRWYLRKFDNYPSDRCTILPFVY